MPHTYTNTTINNHQSRQLHLTSPLLARPFTLVIFTRAGIHSTAYSHFTHFFFILSQTIAKRPAPPFLSTQTCIQRRPGHTRSHSNRCQSLWENSRNTPSPLRHPYPPATNGITPARPAALLSAIEDSSLSLQSAATHRQHGCSTRSALAFSLLGQGDVLMGRRNETRPGLCRRRSH